jgi:hypothetical protein
VECKNKGDTSNNWSDWDHFQIIQKIHERHTGNHDIKELQKTAILGTAHILRKVLTEKNKRANAGTRNRGTINNKDRIVVSMYPLGTWFVWGICVWIPCIKETMMMIIIMSDITV